MSTFTSKRLIAVGLFCLVVGLVYLALRPAARPGQRCPAAPLVGASCSIGGIEFVAIPGGEFAMGDNSSAALPNEQPVHNVTLDPFWMAKTELTLQQWNAFVVATGHPRGRSQAQSENHPVVG